jgi:hypothetical protein
MKNRNQILRQEILNDKLEENVAVITGAKQQYIQHHRPTITFGRQIRE